LTDRQHILQQALQHAMDLKSAALDYAATEIRVNVLVPGAIDTAMQTRVIDQLSHGDDRLRTELEKRRSARIPLGRIGRPEETADAIVWLLSDRSNYLTGSSLIIDGGLSSVFALTRELPGGCTSSSSRSA
jgi:NAD(P)-dependent dehydrogenase (short-subunit alcohol dehydrogenase family)